MRRCIKISIFYIILIFCSEVYAQDKIADTTSFTKVSGVIKAAATGKPLAAINISIPEFSAALTDDNGMFTIKVPDYNATLFLSGEGYQSKEIALRGSKNITGILFEEEYNSIYDNVTLPFGVKPQNQTVNAIGSVITVGSWNRPFETPDSYLQGKVAGLNPVMRSGTPNLGAYLTLRGYNSLYGTNQPLIVVDGMIYDINDYGPSLISNHYTNALADIDVKDIENITVVKDALSTYGTKAANGVILITTSHAPQLATRIDAAVFGGVNFVPDNLPVMQSSDYRIYLSDILKSRGWSDDKIQAQPYMNDNPSNPNYARYHNNTDWQKEVFKRSMSQDLYLKVTGGDNIAKYSVSMGYLKNAGVIKNTDLTKYSVRFNGDLNLSKRLTANTNLSYTYYEQNLSNQGLAFKTSPIYLGLTKAPFLNTNDVSDSGAVSPNLAAVDTFNIGNPSVAVTTIRANSKVYRFFGAVNFKYQLTKAFSLFSLVGVTVDEVREQTFIPRKGIAGDTLANALAQSRLGGQSKRLFNLFNDTYLDYSKTISRIHHVQARAGVRSMHSCVQQNITLGFNSPTDDFISVGTGASALRKTAGDIGKYTWVNGYAGVNYSLSDKYFLMFNVAADGSSRFGSDIPYQRRLGGTSWSLLPSVGASWLLSSEKFMSGARFIDLLKLQASYGKTGNDDIGNYTAKQTYVSQNLLGLQGLVRGNIGNPALQWEENSKANLGLDASLFKERLYLSVNVYQNDTKKMIIYEPMATITGFDNAVTNSGAMKTTGIELSLGGRIINTKSFKWDVAVNIDHYKNTITSLPGNDSIITSFGGATILTTINQPANTFYGHRTAGVYSTDEEASQAGLTKKNTDGSFSPFKGGDIRFIDLNGDKIIDNNDRQVIGNPNPDFSGAIINKITWKSLSLETVMTFSKGNQLYNGVRAALESESTTNNQLISVINRWRAPGQVTSIPKASYGDPMGNSRFSDRWIEDGSFLRMKTISLSYNLPVKASFIKYSTLYITANNLFTFSKYLGYDPEFQAAESILARGVDVGLEPQFKSVNAGIRIGL